MDFRIADTFTDSLARLTADEQKAAKTTAFDLQLNPASPGLSFHKLTKAKDKDFWSVRVNDGMRIIVHRTDRALLLCYVDHHDKAYAWAERRKIERHPATGAAQLVEIRETIREIAIPRYVEPAAVTQSKAVVARPIFADVSEAELLSYGVPPEWMNDVRRATEDSLLPLIEHLPREAGEALLELATGSKPKPSATITPDADAFAHPDAQRRFRIMTDVDELRRALEEPWEKWAVFLHPTQRDVVERRFNGPARVSGSAGTGKTIVAIHRAAALARSHKQSKVLLTTISPVLATLLKQKLERLLSADREVLSRVEVASLDELAQRLIRGGGSDVQPAPEERIRACFEEASAAAPAHKFTAAFVYNEWADVVDAWQLPTWEQYRDVQRLGRKTRLNEAQRQSLWAIFERGLAKLEAGRLITPSRMYAMATDAVLKAGSGFRYAVVDEAQDLSVGQLRLLASIAGGQADGLFFAGDLGQRIFQTPFSWKSLGVDIRGRSHTLRINYRTSRQIRGMADRLLPSEVADVDGVVEQRRGTVSAFDGPPADVREASSVAEEAAMLGAWLRERIAEGMAPEEIGVFVRSSAELPRASAAIEAAGQRVERLAARPGLNRGVISMGTIHQAKGLEFRAVAVIAVDESIVPLESRIEGVSDSGDLDEVYVTERHLLYVACTRARDRLLVIGVRPVSEFLADLRPTR